MQPCDALTQVSASRDAFGNCAGCSIMSPCLRRFSRQNCASRRRGPELFTARVCSAACRRACNTRRASSSFLHLPVSARPRWSASGSPPSPLAPLLLRGGRSEGGELPTGLNILGLAVGATGILSLIPWVDRRADRGFRLEPDHLVRLAGDRTAAQQAEWDHDRSRAGRIRQRILSRVHSDRRPPASLLPGGLRLPPAAASHSAQKALRIRRQD